MSTPTAPKRGGIHPIYGVFVGGAAVDDNYKLKGKRLYKSSTQRRNPKSIGHIEGDLRTARDSTTVCKFHGNLDGTTDRELNKKSFLKTIERLSMEHGHHYLWHYPDPANSSKMVPFFKNVHSFTLATVTAEHEARLAAADADIEAYDDYELDDIAL